MPVTLQKLQKPFFTLALYLRQSFRRYKNSALITVLALIFCLVAAFITDQGHLLTLVPSIVAKVVFSLIAVYAVIALIINIIRMMCFIKPKSPIRHTIKELKDFLGRKKQVINLVYVLLLFSVFAAAFSTTKALIYQLNGFRWDKTFESFDRTISFGSSPHEYLTWLFSTPETSLFIEVMYQLWFYIYYSSIVYVAYHYAHSNLSQRYLLASVLTWFLGGNLIAIIFSSAGPIFPEIHSLETYNDHLRKMGEAAVYFDSFAISVKEKLLNGFQISNLTSISAFPSMHVASTTLMVLMCRQINPKLYLVSVCYLIIIITGSVALLWHYLVDSIAGVFIALTTWGIAGWKPIAERQRSRGAPNPP